MSSELSVLLPYQRDWIADQATVKVFEKSRQIGITWTEAADDALIAATRGRMGRDILYSSYKQEFARKFVGDVAFWAARFNKAASEIEETVFKDADKDILAYRIKFASGHTVLGLSSNPTNMRGYEGAIAIIDEAAFHPHLEEMLNAAMAFKMWGGKVRIISTHDGDSSPFAALVNDIRAGRTNYSLHRADFDDALKQGFYRAVCRKLGWEYSAEAEAAYRADMIASYRGNADEELFCIPRPGGGAYIPGPMIEACQHADIPVLRFSRKPSFIVQTEEQYRREALEWCVEKLKPALERIKPELLTVFGEDFGRSGDLTVLWPLQIDQQMHRRTPFIVEMRNVTFKQQELVLFYMVDALRERGRFIGGAMDARGNGQPMAEAAQHRYGARVEQVMLSIDWYRENMPKFKAAFEDGMIDLPQDSDIYEDIRALRMENGVARVPEKRERGQDGQQRHGDAAIAGALAYYSSVSPKQIYGYETAAPNWNSGKRDDPFADDDYADSTTGPRGWMRERLARFGKGAW